MHFETRQHDTHGLLLLAALSVPFAATIVNAQEMPDTSSWECKYCLFEKGASGAVELGLGVVSDDSFKFGEYNGLHEDGAHAIVNGTLRYFGENAHYMELRARDLGLDTRELRFEGGRQGLYTLILGYDELPHAISDSAMTPFNGSGSGLLTLPPGWVSSGSTAGLTALGSSLQPADLETERQRADLGIRFLPGSNWVFDVDYRHETKQGMRGSAGTFFFDSSHLVEPVDYETDRVDLSVAYNTRLWQAKLGYHLSTFRNRDTSLTWDNPYTALFPGATTGERALPPDNRFHQFLASAGFQFNAWTRINADLAIGRMEQDKDFLAATTNGTLAVPALPRSSLDGQVDTLNANVKLIAAPTERLRINASYSYDDRDNETPQAAYSWVTTDLFVQPATRTNLPYSFTRSRMKLGADYRLPKGARLSGGYDYDNHERTFQEVDETTEHTLWGRIVTRLTDKVHLTAKAAHAERDADAQQTVAEIDPPQNPLMTKYNLADRTRDSLALHAQLTPMERLSVGLGLDLADDDYTDSALGLTASQEWTLSADASLMVGDNTTLYMFFNHQRIESEQRGSQAFAVADWTLENDDTINTLGLGIKHRLVEKKIDLGADIVFSRSIGEIDFASNVTPYPDLESKLTSIKLYADYRLRDAVTLRAVVWHQRYDTENWSLDGVTASTLPNGITFGETSQDYDVTAFLVSMRYAF